MSKCCPYCGLIPEKDYKYGWICNGCRKKVYYNKNHYFIYGRSLLTNEEDAVVELYDSVYKIFGTTESDYNAMNEQLSKQWGIKRASERDTVWGLLNSSEQFKKFMDDKTQILAFMDDPEFKSKYAQTHINDLNYSIRELSNRFLKRTNEV